MVLVCVVACFGLVWVGQVRLGSGRRWVWDGENGGRGGGMGGVSVGVLCQAAEKERGKEGFGEWKSWVLVSGFFLGPAGVGGRGPQRRGEMGEAFVECGHRPQGRGWVVTNKEDRGNGRTDRAGATAHAGSLRRPFRRRNSGGTSPDFAQIGTSPPAEGTWSQAKAVPAPSRNNRP